ncbi:hypothetical protein P4K96_27605 [Bacillus cereus]|uniref:hypothetical protein n=1 Tax=Paenibacillus melissococcoides TaxID=2912268 RepID=UPI0021C4AA23|nr:hypothetical protein [Paenibacillus melissococcoides]MEB9897186.1 hypothetical protein [Bacillus cereus]CAH8721273.1 hypothetical protein HTL2_006276 [Paenibacillus melissococcoides]
MNKGNQNGRQKIGVTKKISVTLPEEDWRIIELKAASYSEGIRNIVDEWRGNPRRKKCGCIVNSQWCKHDTN